MSEQGMSGKDIIKIALNLMVIYVVGGFLLAWVYATTSPIVYKKTQEEKQAALKEMMPGVQQIDKEGDWTTPEGQHAGYYQGKNGKESQGYVVETYGKGYSSYINLMVSADKDFKIKKVKVLHHAETPGLGDEVEAPWFTKQFEGKSLEQMKVEKIEGTPNIQAISGATISSKGATRGVQFALELLKQKYGATGGGMANCPEGMTNCPEHNTGMESCPEGIENCSEHEKAPAGHDMKMPVPGSAPVMSPVPGSAPAHEMPR